MDGSLEIPEPASIAALFAQVLGVAPADVGEEEFFALGGDSLGLLELATLIEREYEVAVDVASLVARCDVDGVRQLISATRPGTA
jgi:acyl carrier protein